MRGADLQSTLAIIEHVRARLNTIAGELSSASTDVLDDGRIWGASVDVAALVPELEVLLQREKIRLETAARAAAHELEDLILRGGFA
jgi:hypothetical protein